MYVYELVCMYVYMYVWYECVHDNMSEKQHVHVCLYVWTHDMKACNVWFDLISVLRPFDTFQVISGAVS